jgi:hypothetical protein
MSVPPACGDQELKFVCIKLDQVALNLGCQFSRPISVKGIAAIIFPTTVVQERKELNYGSVCSSGLGQSQAIGAHA